MLAHSDISLFDIVKLKGGRQGTVIEIYNMPNSPIGYEIEISDNTGITLDMFAVATPGTFLFFVTIKLSKKERPLSSSVPYRLPIAIGVQMDGIRDVLGMWIGENESAKFWLGILNSLKNRGIEDILIACVDGLTGFANAIEAVFPKTEIQQCVIHQIRNSTKYVSYKDIKALMADLKTVYAAVDEQTALYQLDVFDEKWNGKYPNIALSWRANWANLSTYFKYPQEVRTLIYTTNAIENFNRQLRKVTKAKSVFPTDDSLLKMLYLAMMDITKKWTGRRKDWGQIHSQLEIFFADRLD